MSGDMVTLVLSGLVTLVAVVALWRSGIRPTAGAINSKLDEFNDALDAARTLTVSAEQLYTTGKITKGERFDYVLDQLQEMFPNLDYGLLEAVIESSIPFVKIAVKVRKGDESAETTTNG